MKTINALLLLALIFAVNSELTGFAHQYCTDYYPSEYGGSKQAYSLDFCRSTDISNTGDVYRCCFIKYEQNNQRHYHCAGVTNYGFWNIDDTIEAYESFLKVDIDSLDCSASYLYVSLLLIFALLF